MVTSSARMATNVGRKAKVAVLQPFLKTTSTAGRRGAKASAPQDFPRASASFAEACSKLDEAVALADTLGCEVVHKEVVPVRTINPKFLFGSGKVSEMSGMVSASEADAVFVNAPLSGAQQKALGDVWDGATVLDRFRVILDIFADRARTTEAKLQVELAQLRYQAGHLVQSGAAGRDSGYDRQGGGKGAMGGAGEKALEIQRRQLRDRIAEVNKLLKEVEKRRGVQRRTRDRRGEPTVALVGYTNVGKSSLLNRLSLGGKDGGGSGAGKGRSGGPQGKGAVHAQDRVFDTLDPTSRSITLPSLARCVLVDTVGFIQDLPTALVHSFRATLDEVQRADVLLHVRDASSTPRVSEVQRLAVEETLRELGASEIPTVEVWNKVDKEQDREEVDHDDGHHGVDEEGYPRSSSSSSCSGDGDERNPPCRVYVKNARADESGSTDGGMSCPDDEDELHRRILKEHHTAITRGKSESGQHDTSTGHSCADVGIKQPEIRSVSKSTVSGTVRGRHGGAESEDAVRVSAATGDGLKELLGRVDALLHVGGNPRLAPPPAERYRYVRTLPGQLLHK